MGCAEREKYEVVTERVPYLIESITNLRLGNALVLLKACLRGFKDLQRRHGGIFITEKMIGKVSLTQVSIKKTEQGCGSMRILQSTGRKRTRRISRR